MRAKKKAHKAAKTRAPMPKPHADDRDVAEFWETHSVADYWDELEPVTLEVKPVPRQIVTSVDTQNRPYVDT